jgi:hypothetical protein
MQIVYMSRRSEVLPRDACRVCNLMSRVIARRRIAHWQDTQDLAVVVRLAPETCNRMRLFAAPALLRRNPLGRLSSAGKGSVYDRALSE